MRVIHVDSGRQMRGGQWQALRLAEGMLEAGHDPVLLADSLGPLFAEAARRRLGANLVGGEGALPALLYCIARPEEDIRSAAIEVLGRLGYPGAMGPLVEKLKDPSPAIQSQVIAALGNFRDLSLIPLLVPFLDAGDGLLDAEAVRALGKIGAADCEEKFISLLESPHTVTRQAAALALGELPVI